MDNAVNKKRMFWIDCVKCIAIVAVIINHSIGILYESDFYSRLSNFCVCLFIIMSGYTIALSFSRIIEPNVEKYFEVVKKQCVKIFIPYVIASAFYHFYETFKFDVVGFLKGVVEFSHNDPFYYMLVYLQLVIISPFLYSLVLKVIKSKKLFTINLIASFILLLAVSSVLITNTFVLPVYGAGQFLFGGTYLFLMYLGMVFYKCNFFDYVKKYRKIATILSLIAVIISGYVYIFKIFSIDEKLTRFFYLGYNPPSVTLMTYSICITIFAYCIFSFLEEIKNIYIEKTVKICAFIGANTLPIYLYHSLVLKLADKYILTHINSLVVKIVVLFVVVIGVCLFINYVINKTLEWFLSELKGE